MVKNYLVILFFMVCTSSVLAQEKSSTPVSSKRVVLAQEIESLKIYPNPVTEGKLYITTKNNLRKEVVVYDVLGNLVLQAKISNNFLDVSALRSGVYIINIKEGARRSSRRLVIR